PAGKRWKPGLRQRAQREKRAQHAPPALGENGCAARTPQPPLRNPEGVQLPLSQPFPLEGRRGDAVVGMLLFGVEMTEPARESLDPVGVRGTRAPWILEEHPTQAGIVILRRSAEPQLPDGESSEYLLLQHTFGDRALPWHAFGDHRRAAAPGLA